MAFSVVEFGLPACGFSLWRVSLSLTPVVLQLCSLPYSPYLYLRPYAYAMPRKVSCDSCACGRVSWSSSFRSSSWYSASHLPSESVRSDLPVAGIRLLGLLRLGLVCPLLLFLLALIVVFAFCGFVLLVLVLGVSSSVSPSFSFTMAIAWVVSSSSSSSSSPFT